MKNETQAQTDAELDKVTGGMLGKIWQAKKMQCRPRPCNAKSSRSIATKPAGSRWRAFCHKNPGLKSRP
jgi:hypothetical protein